jgi:hypothetical protein
MNNIIMVIKDIIVCDNTFQVSINSLVLEYRVIEFR